MGHPFHYYVPVAVAEEHVDQHRPVQLHLVKRASVETLENLPGGGEVVAGERPVVDLHVFQTWRRPSGSRRFRRRPSL